VVYMAKGAPWAPSFFCRTTAERGLSGLPWWVVVDRFRPDRWDIAAAAVCILGVAADHGMHREADRMSTDRLEGNKAAP